MSAEMNVYEIGPFTDIDIVSETEQHQKYEDYSFHRHGDFSLQRMPSKNMNKLCAYFHSTDNYPEYYLGIAKKMAKCKCPSTGKEHWFNGERCLSIENPRKGSIINVTITIKDKTYTKDVIFMGWVNQPVHEWRMRKGTILQLEQKFIDDLLPEDKRYLKVDR
jgi:hypothetical protein